MKVLKSITVLAICLLIVSADRLIGQSIYLSGIVVNSNQKPVEHVRVYLKNQPELICTTDSAGAFTLTDAVSSVENMQQSEEFITMEPGGMIKLAVRDDKVLISVFDIMGRKQKTIDPGRILNGVYQINPNAYINDLPYGIYIISISGSTIYQSFKIYHLSKVESGLDIQKISSFSDKQDIQLKSLVDANDSLVFQHDFYKTTKVDIPDLKADVGTVEMDNFGNYSLAENIKPDKTVLHQNAGTFLSILGKDSSSYLIQFDSYSSLENELAMVALPVEEYDFLPASFNLVSGVHLEPSGSKFAKPAFVEIGLDSDQPTENLLVFLYDSESDKITYFPFDVIDDDSGKRLVFYMNHFSDIGVVDTENPASAFATTPEDIPEDGFADSDDAMSFIKFRSLLGHEITEVVFEVWYNSVIKAKIDVINDIQSFYSVATDFALLVQYAQYANLNLWDENFYNEAVSNLSAKSVVILNQINTECARHTDECLLRDIAELGFQLVGYTQTIPWIDTLSFIDICDGITLNMVHEIDYDNGSISLDIGETKKLPFRLLNLAREEVTATVTFESEDPGIVEVDENGNITGMKGGSAKVFIRHCELEEYILVSVGVEDEDFCERKPPPGDSIYITRIAFQAEQHRVAVDSFVDGRSDKYFYVAFLYVNLDKHEYKLFWKYGLLTVVYDNWHRWSIATLPFHSGYFYSFPLTCHNSGVLYTPENPQTPYSCTAVGCFEIFPQQGIVKVRTPPLFDQYAYYEYPFEKVDWQHWLLESLYRRLWTTWGK